MKKQTPHTSLKPHPIAELFPLMSESDLEDLAMNIRQSGQQAAITLYEGMILDGRNRYAACELAGVEPVTREFPADKDPLAYVLALNLHRRHLSASQRAMVAANIANLPRGGDRKTIKLSKDSLIPDAPISVEEAAESMQVSVSSVQRARTVARKSPVKSAAVAAGRKTVAQALKEIEAEEEEEAAPDEQLSDELGTVVPAECLDLYRRAGQEVGEILSDFRRLKKKLKALEEGQDIVWRRVDMNGTRLGFDKLAYSIGTAMPFAVCPFCHGHGAKIKCKGCSGQGYLSKYHYGTVPIEMRKDKK